MSLQWEEQVFEKIQAQVVAKVRPFEPVGRTAFLSGSNSNTPTHPAQRELCCPPAAAARRLYCARGPCLSSAAPHNRPLLPLPPLPLLAETRTLGNNRLLGARNARF